MFCGIFGHKPTPNWISIEGHKPSANDKDWSTFFSIGSMVRYATDLPLLLTVISQSDEARITFNKKVNLSDMKYFYMDNCGPIPDSITTDVQNAIYKLMRHLEVISGVRVEKVNFEDMERSFEISSIILLSIKDIYSIFNRWDNPKKSKSLFMEILRYISFMSSHTFPAIFFGLLKNIVENFPVSIYNEMIELRTRLRKQFEVECLQWVIKLLEPLA
ncbi:FAAH2 hydrolase, partial [Pseudoatta argentina]